MSANSKASQLLNGVENFMNGVSNAARDVLVNPAVDLGALAAKGVNVGLDKLTGQNLAKEANKKIDQGAAVLKGEAKNSLQRQPVDPTSTAYAVGEGLTKGIDQAAAVLTLAEAARQLPKAAQKGWKTILNKVKDAKSKSDQMKLAKEAREYLNKAMDENLRPAVNSSAPSYQQKAVAIDNQMRGGNMRTYVDEAVDNSNKTFKNMTRKMNSANLSKDPEAVKIRTARNEVYPTITDYSKQPNKTYSPLEPAKAAEVSVPYKGSDLKEVKNMQQRVNNIAKMSDTEFRKYMDSIERANMAGYGPEWYDYQIEDLWHSAGKNSKALGNLKDQIIDRITYSYDPEQFGKVSRGWQNIAKNNALKNNKVYRKRKVKDIKDKYDDLTKGITRDEARAARQEAAADYNDIMFSF